MTTRLETLRSLQTRLREATGADARLDAEIHAALHGGHVEERPVVVARCGSSWLVHIGQRIEVDVPRYTADPDGLGACVALMREVLPRWLFDIRQQHRDDFQARVHRRCLKRTLHDDVFASHRLATHATLLAIVSALIAIEEAKEKADV